LLTSATPARLLATRALVSVGADGLDGWRVDPAELGFIARSRWTAAGWLISLVYGICIGVNPRLGLISCA
jgi:hypothetical protein